MLNNGLITGNNFKPRSAVGKIISAHYICPSGCSIGEGKEGEDRGTYDPDVAAKSRGPCSSIIL